ncbi:hypothetical protein [Mucilaginibacter sp.]|uniref:hypothetical protein n=1 Tax=Mucilaginibacter sp. TaxID=1882438 RepID=UPI003AFF772F
MPTADILYFLFSATATIIATLTGLLGVFSTFRLQNIDVEITMLKDLVLNRKMDGLTSLSEFIADENYHRLEKIYDRNEAGIDLLEQSILNNNLNEILNKYDLSNLRSNQKSYDTIKAMTIRSFALSLVFVIGSLLLLVFANWFISLQGFYWYITIYFMLIGILLLLYVIQIAKLIE